MPLEIQCSSCGHKGTVPDTFVGREVQCPKCQCLLVPLTAEKMESFAAKVLFSTPAAGAEEVVQEEVKGPEILFACPFCGEAYQVSEDLAGKKITCRNCREPCKVDAPAKKKKKRRIRAKVNWQTIGICVVVAVFFLLLGLLLGRMR